MNKLPLETRAQILNLLVEGSSLRSISRIVDVSINTVTKLLVDAGTVAAAYHDQTCAVCKRGDCNAMRLVVLLRQAKER